MKIGRFTVLKTLFINKMVFKNKIQVLSILWIGYSSFFEFLGKTSSGNGKRMVEFFSAAILDKVW